LKRDRRALRALLSPILGALILLASAAAAQAATIDVNTTSDAAPTAGECTGNPGDCSLRQAVDAASSGDNIQVPAGDYSLTLGTDIEITKSLVIEGAGVSSTSIDGSQNRGSNQYGATARIFRTDSGATVTIEDLTLTGGDDGTDEVPCNACDTDSLNGGGALWNDDATVVIDHVAFTNNSGSPDGGAISTSGGNLTLTNDSFTDDGAGIGGALFTHSGSAVTAADDAFDDDGDMGVIYMFGGSVTLTNSTVVNSGASSEIGGGLHNGGGTLTLLNDTLSGNVRGQLMTDRFAQTIVENTIIGDGFSEGDGDCIAPGEPDDVDDATSGPAITDDLGHNIDQDNSCGLDASGDASNVDPKLVPIADNGGPTQTQALIGGSPALGDPATSSCPSTDQRGTSRPSGKCDIGAFEAVLHGSPDASTGDSSNITDTSADLSATINLDGEAGGFQFLYGTSPSELTSSSPVAAAGVVSTDTPETETVSNLTPGTTYYYEAVADNATASTTATDSPPPHFTTDPAPPLIQFVNVDPLTDTTATIDFSIDPQGADTTYYVEYGPDVNYGQQTQPAVVTAASGAQNRSVTLTGLTPNSTYHFQVVASNSAQEGVESGDDDFTTYQQVTGTAATPQVTVTDSGWTDGDCPSESNTTVDWGDHFSDGATQIECDQYGNFTLSDTHTYFAPGQYVIHISYGDLDYTTTEYAEISPQDGGPTNRSLPEVSGPAEQGQTLDASTGAWDGGAQAYHYQWLDCDASGENCADTGDDSSAYTLTGDDVGDTVRVIVTAVNDGAETGATSDQTDVVQQAAQPGNEQTPVITGVAQQGNTLTTTTGTWDGNPSSFDYQWQDCDVSGQNCTNTGTDSDTYALSAGDVGHTVQVIVTANNDTGTGQATSNLTAKVLPANSAPISNPNPSPPTVASGTPTVSVTGAGFSGSVNPDGLPTQAYFEYGLDPKYTGGGPIVYDQSTQPQSVGSDSTSHSIGPVSVSGLLPNALYHVRLVATNSDGTTIGPDVTFTTKPAPAPSAPTLAQTFNLTPVSGIVLIRVNGKFVPLTGLEQIPEGSEIDARHGSLDLITSNGQKGETQHGTFGGAIFKLTQDRSGSGKGLVTLTLVEGAFNGAPSYGLCTKHKAGDASAAALSSKTLQLLHASAHGKFRTTGRYAAATVRGTIWTIADKCNGTLTHDVTDSVAVTDFVHHKTIILHAGQSYLAKPPTRK